jgi:hypothetical protein
MRIITLLVIVSNLVACSDFDPRSLLQAPRVIGVVAEPPEVGIGDSLTLTSVEYGQDIEERTWSICLLSLGVFGDFACLDESLEVTLTEGTETVELSFTADGIDVFALLTEFSQSTEAQAAAANCGDACIGRDGGMQTFLDLQIELKTRWADGSAMTTYKAVRVRFDDVERNQNPDISDLLVDGEATPAAVSAKTSVTLSVSNDVAVLQRYVDDGGRAYDEEVTLTWYSTAGEFESAVTYGEDLDTVLILPATLTTDTVEVLVVARDGRGGTDYLRAEIPVAQ